MTESNLQYELAAYANGESLIDVIAILGLDDKTDAELRDMLRAAEALNLDLQRVLLELRQRLSIVFSEDEVIVEIEKILGKKLPPKGKRW